MEKVQENYQGNQRTALLEDAKFARIQFHEKQNIKSKIMSRIVRRNTPAPLCNIKGLIVKCWNYCLRPSRIEAELALTGTGKTGFALLFCRTLARV